MTDATNRKLDVENTDEDRISRDDPLFELSQIIGYSERRGAADADVHADEGQMDLEDALLRELEDFSGVFEEDLPEAAAEEDTAIEDEAFADVAEDSVLAAPDLPESSEAFKPEAPEMPDPVEDGLPDTLEAELIDLLGGLGDKAGAEWSEETSIEQEESSTVEDDIGLAEADDEMSPQVPAAAPVWYDQDAQEETLHAEPVRSDDSEILDAFESELSEGFALSFDEEADEAAQSATDESAAADELEQVLEFSLDLEESEEETSEYEPDTNYAVDHVESTYLNEVEAAAEEIAVEAAAQMPPVLETADMPSSDMEAMQPLDLPYLPEVEEKSSAAVDIERELDAALSGYDNYDTGREDNEADMRAAATAAAAADTRLDFDMGAFEDDLSRDLEYVSHDMDARDGDAEYGDADNAGDRDAVAGANTRKPKRGMMIAAAVGGIAILGAIGAFGLTSRDGGEVGAPVLVKADPEPAKIVPEDPGGKEVPNQDRAVYGEVDGNGETAPTQETLVSTSEEPIDLGGANAPALPSSLTETAKVEDRLAPDVAETTAPAASESGTAVLAPRRVRTVIVKPDGTLVETAPEPQAPAVAVAPAPAPAPTGTGTATEEPVRRIDMAANAPQASETSSAPAVPAPAPAADATPVAEQPEPQAATAEQLAAIAEPQVGDEATEEAQQTAVVRQPLRAPSSIPERPADQPVTIVGSDQPATRQVAEVAPQAQTPSQAVTQQQPQQQAVPAGAYTVQIASQPSAELAQASAADLERRYANLIGNRTVAIQQAEIEGRGTYHRVRIVANNRQDAVALCDRIKQEGGSCFVAR